MTLSDLFLYVFALGVVAILFGAAIWELKAVIGGGVLCIVSVLAETALELRG